MNRMYSACFYGIEVDNIQDFFEIAVPSGVTVILHSVFIGQFSDAGDAQDELLPISINRCDLRGAEGTSPTPRPLDPSHGSSGVDVAANNTDPASVDIELHQDTFNIRAGWQYRPTPEERIVIPSGGILSIRLMAAPNDALTMSGTIYFEVIGGASGGQE